MSDVFLWLPFMMDTSHNRSQLYILQLGKYITLWTCRSPGNSISCTYTRIPSLSWTLHAPILAGGQDDTFPWVSTWTLCLMVLEMFNYCPSLSVPFPKLMALSIIYNPCAISGLFFPKMRLRLHSVGSKQKLLLERKLGKGC